jgi:hypothetical protein
MLQSSQAQWQGNQLVWLGVAPPPLAKPRRVVVVMDESANDALPEPSVSRLAGSLQTGQALISSIV